MAAQTTLLIPAPSLTNATINLLSLREFAREELSRALRRIQGEKTIFFEPSLLKPINLITCGTTFLRVTKFYLFILNYFNIFNAFSFKYDNNRLYLMIS